MCICIAHHCEVPLMRYCFPYVGTDQGDHLSGKPGNVREFDREMSGILLKVREMSEKILSGKSCLKLFIVNCIFASIQVFSRSLFCVKYYIYGFGSSSVAFLPHH